MGLHSPISSYRQSVSSDTPSELISPTLSSYSSRRSSEKFKFQGYPSPYSSSPPETMNSSAYSYSSSSSSSHSHPASMSKHHEQHRSQSPRALAPPAAYQSHSVHQAGPQQQPARPQLPPISSFFSHVSFSRPESAAPSFAGPHSPEQRHQQHQSQQRPHHIPSATPSTSAAPPPPYYQSHGSHGGMSINTTIPASNGRPSSSHVSPMSANVPEPYRYDNANSTSSSGRSYSSASSSSRPDYLLSRDSPPQARHQQVQSHSHSRPPLQYSSTEPRHSISAVSVSSQISASTASVQPSADGISTVSPADASPAASASSTQEGLGPKIWTGTHFLPRFIKAAQVPGEGLCYFYDDGTHCKTVIDGEVVNAHWGVTKAGKPRKRLAIACVTCREKKIKCDPDYPRCVQCDKFGRVCRFKNAPRGGQNVAASSQTSTEDSSRRAIHFIRPSTEATSPLPAAPASAPPSIRPHISAPPRRPASPEPLSPHKRMRTSYDTYEHAQTSSGLPPLIPPSQHHHQPASFGHSSLSHMQHHEPWQPVRDISRDLPRLHESLSSTSWNRRDPYVAAP